jgi:hypothetical protein
MFKQPEALGLFSAFMLPNVGRQLPEGYTDLVNGKEPEKHQTEPK